MKLFLSIILFSALLGNTIAQTTHVTVDSKMQFGAFTYYFLEGNNELYKTSAFPDDVFIIGQSIELTENADNNNYDITNPTTSHLGTARILNSSTNTDDINWSELDMPTTWNSMLHFRDTLHAVSFFEELDGVFSADDAAEYDEISMEFLAQYPAYNSFWKHLIDKYGPVYYTDKDLEDLRKEGSALPDPVQQLLVNANRLVRIGNEVIYHNSITQIVSCDANNSLAIQRLEEISQVEGFNVYDPHNLILNNDDFTLLFHNDFYPNDKLPTPDGKGEEKDFRFLGQGMNQVRFRSSVGTSQTVENCNPALKALRIYLYRGEREYYDSNNDSIIDENDDYNWVELPYYYSNAILTIDWDDGSAIQTINPYNEDLVEHEYPTTGTYYPLTNLTVYIPEFNTDITFEDGTNSANPDADHFSFVNNGLQCSRAPYEDADAHSEGDYKLNSLIWVTDNFWGKHFGGRTQCFKKGANDPWSLKRADIISIAVEGVFLNELCNEIKPESGAKTRTNRKEVRKSKTKNWGVGGFNYLIGNEDVTTTHYFTENTNYRNVQMTVNICE